MYVLVCGGAGFLAWKPKKRYPGPRVRLLAAAGLRYREQSRQFSRITLFPAVD